MIHQYINNGYHIVLDVNSGSVHVVDPVVYDAIAAVSEQVPEMDKPEKLSEEVTANVHKKLDDTYGKEMVGEALEDIQELIDAEQLLTRDIYRDFVLDFKKRKTVVKALCLHIAHDCNLACRYCFAEEGEYHGRRALMSFEVGKKALDFLVANSGNREHLEVDFFGGEPLLNWKVVKQLVEYGRSLEEANHKKFRFTLTTNGVLLNDEIMEFCNREMSNVVLSLDGRKEINDKMRPFRNGSGSYDMIVPKFQKFLLSFCTGNYMIVALPDTHTSSPTYRNTETLFKFLQCFTVYTSRFFLINLKIYSPTVFIFVPKLDGTFEYYIVSHNQSF